jgi:hypothetical protein
MLRLSIDRNIQPLNSPIPWRPMPLSSAHAGQARMASGSSVDRNGGIGRNNGGVAAETEAAAASTTVERIAATAEKLRCLHRNISCGRCG